MHDRPDDKDKATNKLRAGAEDGIIRPLTLKDYENE